MYTATTRIVRSTNRRIDVRIICVFPVTRPIETVTRQALFDPFSPITSTCKRFDRVKVRILLFIVEVTVIHECDFDVAVEEGRPFDAFPDAAVQDSAIPLTDKVDLLALLDSHICVDARCTVKEVLIPFRGSFGVRLVPPVDVGLGKSVAKDGGSVDGLGEFIGLLVCLWIGEAGEEDEGTLGSNESCTDLVVVGIVACCGAGGPILGGYSFIIIAFSQASRGNTVFGQWRSECC